MDPTTYPLSNFAVCIGQGAYAAQVKAYKHKIKQRELNWDTARNRWSIKIAQFKKGMDEGVLAYSRKIGAIQRRFGLVKEKFLVQNEGAYKNFIQKRTINEGGRARGFGRNQALAFYSGMTQRKANLLRGSEARDVMFRQAGRELEGYRNKLLTQRGFAPIPGLAPVKPTRPSQLEFGLQVAQTAVGLASGIQGIGQAAGWKGDFFNNPNPTQTIINNYG